MMRQARQVLRMPSVRHQGAAFDPSVVSAVSGLAPVCRMGSREVDTARFRLGPDIG
jgi:hypothetical protein